MDGAGLVQYSYLIDDMRMTSALVSALSIVALLPTMALAATPSTLTATVVSADGTTSTAMTQPVRPLTRHMVRKVTKKVVKSVVHKPAAKKVVKKFVKKVVTHKTIKRAVKMPSAPSAQ